MRLFSLDNRLSLCASFVRSGVKLADIGTDHAYLPVWLVKNGVIPSALACDINEGPLSFGLDTVKRYELTDCIQCRLSDGLKEVNEDEVDDIVIAGMGGELIAKILSDCTWAKSEEKHFILQPMTKCEALVEYLYKNGFEILEQKACECDKKHYTVMLAKYTGKLYDIEKSFLFVGKLDLNDDSSKLYLSHVLSHLKKRSLSDKTLLPVIEKIEGELQDD